MSVNMVQKLPRIKVVGDRSRFILEYCRGRNVLHLGCVASGFAEEWLRDGSLLHCQIRDVANRTIGVDIDGEGIELLRAGGIPDLIQADVSRLNPADIDVPIDTVVAGEVLEHLSDPGMCLCSLAAIMHDRSVLVVSVPNAFSLRHFSAVFWGRRELVMPDHNFYFSYSTLKSLLEKYGFEVTSCCSYLNIPPTMAFYKRTIKRVLAGSVFRLIPFSAEGLIFVATKRGSSRRGMPLPEPDQAP